MQPPTPKNPLGPDIPREQARKKTYAAILAKILSGELAPGQRLREEELAQTYKLSRTPIREILIALEKDGLVQRIRNQGAKVMSFTPDDLEELYDMRCALECLAVRRAVPHMPLNQLLEFEQRLAVLLREPGGPKCNRRLAQIDIELHRLIVTHSGNRRLMIYLENISLLPHSLRLAGYDDDKHAHDVGQEHLMLVQALLRRDGPLAERLLASHIENGKRKMLDLLCQRREPLSKPD